MLKDVLNTVILGDCLEKLKDLPDNSIDAIITDPPYGISFMGKDWDKFNEVSSPQGAYEKQKGFTKLPRNKPNGMLEFFVPIWEECFRVLKSGSFIFTMCASRSDTLSRQIIALEEAGFNIGFSPIYWTYSTGFPKAMNLAKAIDKKLGTEKRKKIPFDSGFIRNPKVVAGGHSVDDGMRPYVKKARKDGFYEILINEPQSPQAKKVFGAYAGFQPKPAIEVILVAMKPLVEGTYIEQAMAWCEKEDIGLGGVWFDECRIPFISAKDQEKSRYGNDSNLSEKKNVYKLGLKPMGEKILHSSEGRFPANLLVSDKILNDGKEHSVSGSAKLGKKHTGGHKQGFLVAPQTNNLSPNDSGQYSRYFDLDFWFQKRIEKLPREVQKIFPFLKVPKASRTEKEKGLTDLPLKTKTDKYASCETKCKICGKFFLLTNDPCMCDENLYGPKSERAINPRIKNFHPTVKPIKLMCYLITLALGKSHFPEKRIVLDPFAGTGTTGIAAHLLGFPFILIEKNPEYYELARKRLNYYLQNSLVSYLESDKNA